MCFYFPATYVENFVNRQLLTIGLSGYLEQRMLENYMIFELFKKDIIHFMAFFTLIF